MVKVSHSKAMTKVPRSKVMINVLTLVSHSKAVIKSPGGPSHTLKAYIMTTASACNC